MLGFMLVSGRGFDFGNSIDLRQFFAQYQTTADAPASVELEIFKPDFF
jgi:hypothetical protein